MRNKVTRHLKAVCLRVQLRKLGLNSVVQNLSRRPDQVEIIAQKFVLGTFLDLANQEFRKIQHLLYLIQLVFLHGLYSQILVFKVSFNAFVSNSVSHVAHHKHQSILTVVHLLRLPNLKNFVTLISLIWLPLHCILFLFFSLRLDNVVKRQKWSFLLFNEIVWVTQILLFRGNPWDFEFLHINYFLDILIFTWLWASVLF